MCIDQLDCDLATSGLSPHAPLLTSYGYFFRANPQLLTTIAAEIKLAQLQQENEALELSLKVLRRSCRTQGRGGGVVSAKHDMKEENHWLASWVLLRCTNFRILKVGDGRLCCCFLQRLKIYISLCSKICTAILTSINIYFLFITGTGKSTVYKFLHKLLKTVREIRWRWHSLQTMDPKLSNIWKTWGINVPKTFKSTWLEWWTH